MIYVVTAMHILVSLFLIAVVLLQTGKRADLAGAFGGGGSQTAFGARGAATVLSKATTVAAVIFMMTSLGLALLSSREGRGQRSVLDEVPPPATSAPAPDPQGADTGLPPLEPSAPEQQTGDPPSDAPSDEAGRSDDEPAP